MPGATPRRDAITDVPGIRVGHWTDRRAATGCTVVLAEAGVVGGVSVRGAAPGTRETDVLRPGNLVPVVHAVLLTGGSAYGLGAADGVMRYLRERGSGFPVGTDASGERQVVPIVPAAVLFDLAVGRPRWPDAAAGYRAAAAATGGRVREGSVGAGMGATVAKFAGRQRALRGGLGTASELLDDGTVAGALVVVNAWGTVRDPLTAETIAAPRADGGAGFVDVDALIRAGFPAAARFADAETDTDTDTDAGDAAPRPAAAEPRAEPGAQTTIGVVATDARLTREQAHRLAEVTHNGLARTLWPAHTQVDGDVLFVLATGERALGPAGYLALEAIATRAVERAVLRGVERASPLGDIPAAGAWPRA